MLVSLFMFLKSLRKKEIKVKKKIEKIEGFVVSLRRRHQKKIKQGEMCPRNDFKAMKTVISMLFKQSFV